MNWPEWLYRLNDPRDRWFADDKLAHGFGAWAVAADVNVPTAGAAAIVVEIIEVVRWYSHSPTQRLLIEDGHLPWPSLCDRVSPKDLVWCAAGIGWHLLLGRIGI